jgi:DNA-binding CsgD family transcriptional regulator
MIAVRLRIALAVLELSSDDGDASWAHVAQLFYDVEELDVYLARLAGSAAIEALIAIDDLCQAERLLAQIEQRAAGGDTALRPLALRCRGLLLAAQGANERASASLEAAAVAPDPPQGVNPFELGRTLLALGMVQRRAQHKRAARESLERAAETFERLGARVWSAKTRSELQRIGGRAPSRAELTATERRLAELVAEGRSNKEAAAALFVTPKTVETTLSRIYAKLGIHSRTELARRLAESKL